jgi:ankyrin repeat protein
MRLGWLRNHFKSEKEALHACIRDGNLQQLRELLSASPAPHISYNHPGFGPPIHFAAYCGNLDAVELLLAAGADPQLSRGEQRLPAIGYAALSGQRDVVKRLWRLCPPEDHTQGVKPYQVPLVVAARYGKAAVVEDLLDWWDGWSQDLKVEALMWAARRWHFEVAVLLLERTFFEQSTIQEALHIAVKLKSMLENEFKPKFESINYINQQMLIALLIDAGADPNSCPDNTPLIYGAAYDAALTGALKTMLEKGADPNKTNAFGRSALHVLAEPVSMGDQAEPEYTNETGIRLLLQHKASVSQPDNAGECPLHRAAYGLDLRLFRLYLSSRPDQGQDALLQLTSHNGETLLHFAAAGCRIEVMEFLVAQGLDINAKNSTGWTPLMCALVPFQRESHQETKSPTQAIRAAQCLLSHGADANVTINEGWTPLHGLALHRNDDDDESGKAADLTRDLIFRGVDPEARARLLSPDSSAASPLDNLPWDCRLRNAGLDPSTQETIIQPDLPPVYWAAERGAIGVMKALLAHGVNVSSMDEDYISPARMAAESKFLKRKPMLVNSMIELLLAAGAGF